MHAATIASAPLFMCRRGPFCDQMRLTGSSPLSCVMIGLTPAMRYASRPPSPANTELPPPSIACGGLTVFRE
jgi:hypothetical protein